MAIMQSCCCWRTVRRGSFACAIYTMFYYSVLTVTIATYLQQESIDQNQTQIDGRQRSNLNSVLEQEVSSATMGFNKIFLACASCGVICCLLLLYGLFKDEKKYMLPWIGIVIVCSFVDISHLIYLSLLGSLNFNPISAMLFTLDFFLLSLNAYSVLCVISQYQEYAAGRGTASDDCRHRVPAVRYNVQATPTATSCLSSKRATTNNDTRPTSATPTQSPTTMPFIQLTVEARSPSSRKHVQFPDPEDSTTSPSEKANEEIPPPLESQCIAMNMGCLIVPANHHYSHRTTSQLSADV